jgi:hypothetical protein
MITLVIHLSDGDMFGQPIARESDARPTFEAYRAMLAGSPLGLRAVRFQYITAFNRCDDEAGL